MRSTTPFANNRDNGLLIASGAGDLWSSFWIRAKFRFWRFMALLSKHVGTVLSIDWRNALTKPRGK